MTMWCIARIVVFVAFYSPIVDFVSMIFGRSVMRSVVGGDIVVRVICDILDVSLDNTHITVVVVTVVIGLIHIATILVIDVIDVIPR